jgi:hypothetical protein
LRELLLRDYGQDAHVLVGRLEALSKDRNKRVALAPTQTLLSYHAGPPQHTISVDVTTAAPRMLTADRLPFLTAEELRTLQAINGRLWPEQDPERLLPPDGRDDATETRGPPGTPRSGPT